VESFEKSVNLYQTTLRDLYPYLRQECRNSKFGFFELLVWKETFADSLLRGVV